MTSSYEAAVAPFRSGASTAKFPLAKPIAYEVIGLIATRLRDVQTAEDRRS